MLPYWNQLELRCSGALNNGSDRCAVTDCSTLSIVNSYPAHASGIMLQGNEIHLGTVACVSEGLLNAYVPDIDHSSELLRPNLSRTYINDSSVMMMMTACHDASHSASA